MTDSLFNEFDPVSAKQWKQKIQFDLKGADYNDTLIWQSAEGVNVKPFYHRDDFKDALAPIPGHPISWNIAQAIFIDNEIIANKLAIDAVERGAESIFFTSEKEFDVTKVFSNFDFTTPIHFKLSFLSEKFIINLKQYFSTKNATVYYNIDLIANLATDGNWFHNLKQDYQILGAIIKKSDNENIIGVDGSIYQNAGANMVQQLAYCLGHANEYLNHFQEHKNLNISFQLSIGTNYFFEIAKIRALRKLYASLAQEYGFNTICHITAIPSRRNKTLYDYNVNMLRTTSECMSAILGGANTVCNIPYDAIYHKSNEFGERISRNQLLILKSESYFDATSNASDGSYYIENLTNELAEKALIIFKDIESSGGFLKQLKEGIIQRKIKESATKEQTAFKQGKVVLLGTNKHPNDKDKMAPELELYPFVKTKARKTLIVPIIPRRLAEEIEQERLKHE